MADGIESPFRPREKLIEKQKYFQSIHKHTYLKGPMDKITSVAIPLALAASSLYLIVRFYLTNVTSDICSNIYLYIYSAEFNILVRILAILVEKGSYFLVLAMLRFDS